MPKRTRRYENDLVESLKDPKEAVTYLNVHLQDDSEDSEELFLLALRDVARALGIGSPTERAVLSSEGNPKFYTLKSLLKSMGLKLSIEQEEKKAS